MPAPSPYVLEARAASIHFGGLKALTDFSLALGPRDLIGLIGPNGAGKTTAFNLLTGVYQPTSGDIMVQGERVNGLRPHKIVARGLARTFQSPRLFKDLSALDNVRIGCHHRMQSSWLAALAQTRAFLAEEQATAHRATELLTVMGLADRRSELARNLPYGDQRRLEIARALATSPRGLLLDEPAAGMNPREKVELMATIHRLRDEFQVAVLLIEHDVKLVMGVCEHIVVLDHGVQIAAGPPAVVRTDPKVIEAYLGESHAEVSTAADPDESQHGGG